MGKRAAAGGVLIAVFILVWAVSLWRQVADLRSHGVEVTAKVEMVVREGKEHRALLEIPEAGGGTAEAWMDVQPLSKAAEGSLIEVTYDPAHPDTVQRGWGIDYATPILVTLAAAVATPAAVIGVRAAATGRPLPSFHRRRFAEPPRPRRRRPTAKRKRRR